MNILIKITALVFLLSTNLLAQVPSASMIEREQEILEKEEKLRDNIVQEKKVFIKRIAVEGATLLKGEEIKQVILPFQKHWLSQYDIQQILDLFNALYKQKGYQADIAYEIKKGCLMIKITEGRI